MAGYGMMPNYGYGNMNPYMQQPQRYGSYLEQLGNPQQAAPVQITRVNGKPGAEAFQMPPNSSILLLDETNPIVWLKQTDGAGYATCTPYQIAPYNAQPEPDYNSFEKRLSRLEAMVNEPDHADVKPAKRSKPAGAD